MKIKLSILLCCAMVSFSSCTVAKISGSGPVPVYMNIGHEKVSRVIHVESKRFRAFDYTASFDVAEALKKKYDREFSKEQTVMFDAMTNVKVVVKINIGNWLVNVLTLGLANSRTIKVEADMVWYQQ